MQTVTAFMPEMTMQQVGNKWIDLFWYVRFPDHEVPGKKHNEDLQKKAMFSTKKLIEQLRQNKVSAPVIPNPDMPVGGIFNKPNLVFSRRVLLDRLGPNSDALRKILSGVGFTFKPMTASSSEREAMNITAMIDRVAGVSRVAFGVKGTYWPDHASIDVTLSNTLPIPVYAELDKLVSEIKEMSDELQGHLKKTANVLRVRLAPIGEPSVSVPQGQRLVVTVRATISGFDPFDGADRITSVLDKNGWENVRER
jgi:hypothetical protein